MPDDTALPPLPEYAGQVRDAADSLMDTGGEPSLLGSEIRAEVVEAFHRAGNSALLAACSVVGEARQRRSVGVFYQRAPYDLQERRVAEFIARQTGIGAGMDQVGFLIASNAFMAGERKQIMRPPLPAWLLGGWHARGPCISRESPAADRRRGCGGDCDCGGRGSGWSALAEQPQGPAEFRPLRLRVPEAPLPARPPNPNPRGFPCQASEMRLRLPGTSRCPAA